MLHASELSSLHWIASLTSDRHPEAEQHIQHFFQHPLTLASTDESLSSSASSPSPSSSLDCDEAAIRAGTDATLPLSAFPPPPASLTGHVIICGQLSQGIDVLVHLVQKAYTVVIVHSVATMNVSARLGVAENSPPHVARPKHPVYFYHGSAHDTTVFDAVALCEAHKVIVWGDSETDRYAMGMYMMMVGGAVTARRHGLLSSTVCNFVLFVCWFVVLVLFCFFLAQYTLGLCLSFSLILSSVHPSVSRALCDTRVGRAFHV
jgi:hypothetical protein